MAEYTGGGGGGGGSIDPHSSTHEAGGSDEVSVATALLVDDAVTSAKIASGAVGNTQVANGDTYNWTDVHQWTRSEPSSGTNTWTSLVNSTSGDTWSFALKSNGYMSLLSGTSEVLEVDNSGVVDSQSPINIEADLRVWDLIEWGSSAEITSRYSSGNDAWELLDSINIRLRVDRSTGDLSVEGTVTEGANL